MKLHIQNGRVIDPSSGYDQVANITVENGKIVSIGKLAQGLQADSSIDATGLVVCPGLVDLCARLREPGYEHEGMLESELAAAVAGGVTSLVCPPDTDPVLDEQGLVEMLKHRAQRQGKARLFPLGAITRNLKGEVLAEMAALQASGCVGFGQADSPLANTQVLQRAMQYAETYGYTLWLRPMEVHLSKGVAASGALATRLGLPGVPVAAETIALHTIFELMRATGARVHLCRLSSAAGVALVRAAKAEGLKVTADVSINSLMLTDADIGYFDSRARLSPPLRQQRDRQALQAALADGTVDALVSDHMPVEADEKLLPFGEAVPGATGLELILPIALKWAALASVPLPVALARITSHAAQVINSSNTSQQLGRLQVGGPADLCVFDPQAEWSVTDQSLRSQGKYTPFAHDMSGTHMQGRVRYTVVAGQVAYRAAQP
jgi:dihydroorotase